MIFSQLAPQEAGDFGVELQKLGGFGAKAAIGCALRIGEFRVCVCT